MGLRSPRHLTACAIGVVAATVLSTIPGHAQVPPFPPVVRPTLHGTVSDETGAPVPGIPVVVFPDGAVGRGTSGDAGARRRVVTDAAGAFAFADLPPGSYRVAVADASALENWPEPDLLARLAPASLPVAMTAAGGVVLRLSVSGEPGVRRILTGQMATSVAEVVPPGGRRGVPGGVRGRGGLPAPPMRPAGTSSVAGVVTARGVPVAGITVALLLPRTVNAQREFARLGEPTITDEQGRYEIPGVRAGTFAVVALAHGVGLRALLGGRSPAPIPAGVEAEDVLATTFHPSAVHAVAAALIEVADNERRDNVDIDMQRVPAVRVAGRITQPAGPIHVGLGAVLLPADPADQVSGSNVRRVPVTQDGRFDFARVPAGEYELSINAPNGWVRRRVDALRDLDDLSIELQPTYTIAGRVEFRSTGRAAQPGNPAQVTIRLMPERLQSGASVPTTNANADGTFTLRGATGGRHRLQATTTEAWVQSSGMLGTIDTLDQAIDVASDRDDGLVVMVDAETAVLGGVVGADGRPVIEGRVVVFPSDRAHWRSGNRRVLVLRLTPNGTFTVSALPAGEYFAAFIPTEVTGPVTNRTLDTLLPSASPFLLSEGEQKRITVRVK